MERQTKGDFKGKFFPLDYHGVIMQLSPRLSVFFDRALNFLAFLAAAMLAFIMLSVTYEVIVRNFFNNPTSWVLEITEILLLYITFLPVAWLLRNERHVTMDFLLTRLKTGPRALLNVITSSICAIAFLVIAGFGLRVTWKYFLMGAYRGAILEIPDAYILIIIPIGSLFLFIQFLRRVGTQMKIWRTARLED
jgi:TRAP-type C4-dicarboxylate transport system permease small subunit